MPGGRLCHQAPGVDPRVEQAQGPQRAKPSPPALTSRAGDRCSSTSRSLRLPPRLPGALPWGRVLCRLCQLSSRTRTLALLGQGPWALSQAWSIHIQPAGCRQRAKLISLCSSSDPQPSRDPVQPLMYPRTQQAPAAHLWPGEGCNGEAPACLGALPSPPSAGAHTPGLGRPPSLCFCPCFRVHAGCQLRPTL